jgi:hypothetical protein
MIPNVFLMNSNKPALIVSVFNIDGFIEEDTK